MLTFRELFAALKHAGVDGNRPVIAHASLSAFGEVQGGVDTLLGALLAAVDTIIMPAFTYKTMVTPEVGPPNNALDYGSDRDRNMMAEFFRPDMPVDRLIGAVPEGLRRHPNALRSMHPILSFVGVNAEAVLASQTLAQPLGPIEALYHQDGLVVLLGVNHTVNTSIHFAECRAGRRQFIRWALTPAGVIECPAFPGCSDGFDVLAPRLAQIAPPVKVGPAAIQAVPLRSLVSVVQSVIQANPLALLCERSYCERCRALRQDAAL